MKNIEIMKIFIAIQDVKSMDKYNVFLFEVRKQIDSNKILVVYLPKKDAHIGVNHKRVYELVKENTFNLCVSSIKELVSNSTHISLYGFKYEHDMIVQYIENFNSVLIEGVTSQKLSLGQEIFLLDTDSQSNKWKWDIYQIKPITIGVMLAIRHGINRKYGSLLNALNKSLED